MHESLILAENQMPGAAACGGYKGVLRSGFGQLTALTVKAMGVNTVGPQVGHQHMFCPRIEKHAVCMRAGLTAVGPGTYVLDGRHQCPQTAIAIQRDAGDRATTVVGHQQGLRDGIQPEMGRPAAAGGLLADGLQRTAAAIDGESSDLTDRRAIVTGHVQNGERWMCHAPTCLGQFGHRTQRGQLPRVCIKAQCAQAVAVHT